MLRKPVGKVAVGGALAALGFASQGYTPQKISTCWQTLQHTQSGARSGVFLAQPDVALYDALDRDDHIGIKVYGFMGLNVNKKDQDGLTLLHHYARAGNEKMVRKLLAAGADVTCRDRYGNSALHLVALNPLLTSIVTILLDAGADPNSQNCYGETPMHNAARKGGFPALAHMVIFHDGDLLIEDVLGVSASDIIQKMGMSPSELGESVSSR